MDEQSGCVCGVISSDRTRKETQKKTKEEEKREKKKEKRNFSGEMLTDICTWPKSVHLLIETNRKEKDEIQVESNNKICDEDRKRGFEVQNHIFLPVEIESNRHVTRTNERRILTIVRNRQRNAFFIGLTSMTLWTYSQNE